MCMSERRQGTIAGRDCIPTALADKGIGHTTRFHWSTGELRTRSRHLSIFRSMYMNVMNCICGTCREELRFDSAVPYRLCAAL